MCSRYYIDEDTAEDVLRDLPGLDSRLPAKGFHGDVCPSETAPVILSAGNRLCLTTHRWGYPGAGGRGLVINARAESVEDRRMFRNGFRYRRIVIPAGHFYEWNQNKEKYTCRHIEANLLYMAGIADLFEEEDRFVILTTQANTSMKRIHDRMPLILESGQVEAWIRSETDAHAILRQTPVQLMCTADYEQLSLFDL